ncbi:MAG: D-alanyl-D-alanine carboxypeptidase [Oscillospiraceae bacterium]|nr:D-alanyl-D-alanine carboxypeptidase [Oscillospiraceae bacterium]MCL2278315.1 D-alanyl-D-alanine carboxypeptidase [Oscillospiraceae bacterium]
MKRASCIFSRFFAVLIVTVLLLAFFSGNSSLAVEVADEIITSAAAIVIDFDTGLVIFEYNAHEQRVPASMAKMIAAYIVLDAISDGIISFDTLVPTSAENTAFSRVRAYSNIVMPTGSAFTVRELMEAAVVRSAGAATVQMGEAVFETEEATVAAMNEKMRELGIEAALFDSWGRSPLNMISAHGMAEVTRSMINSHPVILEITSMETIEFDGNSFNNTNFLLGEYEGIDGFKTGFTNPAGWCFTGTAVQNGRRIIAVTMGSLHGERFNDTRILLDYGFNNVGTVITRQIMSEMSVNTPHAEIGSPFIPIPYFNVELAEHFTLRELAIILNESHNRR